MSDAALLKVRDLEKRYYGVEAVAGINLDIAAGGIVALIGPNGSGKSTTIDCLTGFQTADGGRWWLEGRELTGRPAHQLAQFGLSRTFQNVRIFNEMSLVDSLLVAGRPSGWASWWSAMRGNTAERQADAAAGERALELLNLVGISEYAHAPTEILSYGQRKLLAIAASIMAHPKLVMLDEPVAGVNPTMIGRIESVIGKLVDEGVTLLIVEHNMDFVMANASRVIVLASGAVIADGAPDEVRQNPRVLDAYLGTASQRTTTDAGSEQAGDPEA